MGMNNNEEKRSVGAHNLILEERGNLTITGVEDVDSFDEETVRGPPSRVSLTPLGRGRHTTPIAGAAGERSLEGQIDSLSYADQPAARGGFFARMFR